MAIALCHTLPRDHIMRACVGLLLLSFILSVVAIAERNQSKSAGTLELSDDGTTIAHVRSNAEIYTIDGSTSLCSQSVKPSSDCKDFLRNAEACGYLVVIAVASVCVSVFFIALVVTPCSSTTTAMVLYFWTSILPAFLFTIIAFGLYVNDAIPAAKAFGKNYLTGNTKSVDYKWGGGINLLVAAAVFVILAFILASARVVIAIFLRQKEKQQHVDSKSIAGVMKMHIVNDDWKRQKEMWKLHAQGVHLERQVIRQDVDDGHSDSDKSADDETPQVFIHRRPSVYPGATNEDAAAAAAAATGDDSAPY